MFIMNTAVGSINAVLILEFLGFHFCHFHCLHLNAESPTQCSQRPYLGCLVKYLKNIKNL